MFHLLFLSLFFQFSSLFTPYAEAESHGGFQFSNYKKRYVDMPKGLEQAVKGLGVYDHTLLSGAMAEIAEKKSIDADSLLTNARNTGIFDNFCDAYEPAVDLNPSGHNYDKVKITLAGKIPYSTNFTTTVVLVEYDVRSYCDNKFVLLLLNSRGSRVLSLARVAVGDFGDSRVGYTRLTQGQTFYYQDKPSSHVEIDIEGLKILKAKGKRTPEKQDDWADYVINHATFRIDKDGYIEVVEKGKV